MQPNRKYATNPKAVRARERLAKLSPEQREATRKRTAEWRAKNPDYGRKWYEANREKHLENTRKWGRVYSGVVSEHVHGELPSGHCEICGKHAKKLRFDHDHETGEFRGWLCHRCNVGLRYIEESTYMHAALSYLARTSVRSA
jgi:hypothetical protein